MTGGFLCAGKPRQEVRELTGDNKEAFNNLIDIVGRVTANDVEGDILRWSLCKQTGINVDIRNNDAAINSALHQFMNVVAGRYEYKKAYSAAETRRAMSAILRATDKARDIIKTGHELREEFGGSVVDLRRAMEDPENRQKIHGLEGKITALPFTMLVAYERRMPAGEKIFEDIAHVEATHGSRVSGFNDTIKRIVNDMDSMIGETYASDGQKLKKLEDQLMMLSTKRSILQQAKVDAENGVRRHPGDTLAGRDPKEYTSAISELSARIESVKDERTAHLVGNTSSRTEKAIVDMLQEPDPGKRMAIASRLHRSIASDPSIPAGAEKIVPNELGRIVSNIKNLYEQFIPIADETVASLRSAIDSQMKRLGATDAEREEARDLVSAMGRYEEGYFTHQSVINNEPFERMRAIREVFEYLRTGGAKDASDGLKLIKARSKFMHQRSGAIKEDEMSYSIAHVLSSYIGSMLHTNLVARMADLEMTAVGDMFEMAMRNNNQDLEAYSYAMERYFDHVNKRMFGTSSQDVYKEMVNLAASLGVLSKLSVLRPASMLRNTVESKLYLAMRVGRANMVAAHRELKDHEVSLVFTDIINKTKIGIGIEEHSAQRKFFAGREVQAVLGIDGQMALLNTEDTRAVQAAESVAKLNEAIGVASSKVLMKAWMMRENTDRQNSFKIGVGLGAMFVRRVYEPLMASGYVPDSVVKKYGLNRDIVNSGDPDRTEYRKILYHEMLRHGLNILNETQGFYNVASRHRIEDWGNGSGRLFGMLRQFSINQNTRMYMIMRELHYAQKAGGGTLRFLEATEMEKKAGFAFHPAAAWALCMGLTTAVSILLDQQGISGIRATGWFSNDPAKIISTLWDSHKMEGDDRKYINFGHSIESTFAGPGANNAEFMLNLIALNIGMERGTLPPSAQDAAQFLLGMNLDPKVLGMGDLPEDPTREELVKGTAYRTMREWSFARDVNNLIDVGKKGNPDDIWWEISKIGVGVTKKNRVGSQDDTESRLKH